MSDEDPMAAAAVIVVVEGYCFPLLFFLKELQRMAQWYKRESPQKGIERSA